MEGMEKADTMRNPYNTLDFFNSILLVAWLSTLKTVPVRDEKCSYLYQCLSSLF